LIAVHFNTITRDGGVMLNRKGSEISFSVEGHAGFDQKGSDIVCAAVSVLAQTAVIAINRIAGIHQRIEQREGFLKSVLEIDEDDGRTEVLRIILATMIIGLDEIVKVYPERLVITYR